MSSKFLHSEFCVSGRKPLKIITESHSSIVEDRPAFCCETILTVANARFAYSGDAVTRNRI